MNDNPTAEGRLSKLETKVDMLDRLFHERIEAVDRAIVLQAREYARRLEELNHAHQNAVQDRAGYLQREVWEANRKELEVWKTNVTSEMAVTRGKAIGWSAAIALTALLVALASLAMRIIK
jgi:hypothetical protein